MYMLINNDTIIKDDDIVRFVTVGTVCERKNQILAIKAVEKLKNENIITTITKTVNKLYTISLCKNLGRCLFIAVNPIYNKNPNIPPKQFSSISSISKVLPILICTNSIVKLVINVMIKGLLTLAEFNIKLTINPNGINIKTFPTTFHIKYLLPNSYLNISLKGIKLLP